MWCLKKEGEGEGGSKGKKGRKVFWKLQAWGSEERWCC